MVDGIPNRPLYFYQKDIIGGNYSSFLANHPGVKTFGEMLCFLHNISTWNKKNQQLYFETIWLYQKAGYANATFTFCSLLRTWNLLLDLGIVFGSHIFFKVAAVLLVFVVFMLLVQS